ncbi:aldo/keto reductase [Catenulispora subtropica]|uniref:L-glyceraldehyde 3-phosphate reductase n=1 Tax=Catenulispora subtropica TaxID=450798 RepID=A0ABN2SK96_9ACTN
MKATTLGYTPDENRYRRSHYRRCGASGLKLPALSLGLWYSFGDDFALDNQRSIICRAFDLGINHFDLADKYGRPDGSAEESFGRILRTELAAHRDELLISTKAGYPMWPGPYGGGASRKHLLAGLDQSLRRLGVDHVDVFYSHRPDPDTPIEETMLALSTAARQGKIRYPAISSYSPEGTRHAAQILHELGTPLLLHQPEYSMLNRGIERDLLDTVAELNIGCATFSPLAQGVLTGKYGDGVPDGSRAGQGRSLSLQKVGDETLARVRALRHVASRRGQSLAQLALSWALRDDRITSVIMGVSSVQQLDENFAAQKRAEFTDLELKEIDDCLSAPS